VAKSKCQENVFHQCNLTFHLGCVSVAEERMLCHSCSQKVHKQIRVNFLAERHGLKSKLVFLFGNIRQSNGLEDLIFAPHCTLSPRPLARVLVMLRAGAGHASSGCWSCFERVLVMLRASATLDFCTGARRLHNRPSTCRCRPFFKLEELRRRHLDELAEQQLACDLQAAAQADVQ
jgi:hypothetical protein